MTKEEMFINVLGTRPPQWQLDKLLRSFQEDDNLTSEPLFDGSISRELSAYPRPKVDIKLSKLNNEMKKFEVGIMFGLKKWSVLNNPLLFSLFGHEFINPIGLARVGDSIFVYNVNKFAMYNIIVRDVRLLVDCKDIHPRLAYMLGEGPRSEIDMKGFNRPFLPTRTRWQGYQGLGWKAR